MSMRVDTAACVLLARARIHGADTEGERCEAEELLWGVLHAPQKLLEGASTSPGDKRALERVSAWLGGRDARPLARRIDVRLRAMRLLDSTWNRRKIAEVIGVHADHLGAFLSGNRGAPESWGARGGKVSVVAIERALGLEPGELAPAKALQSQASAALALAGPRLGPDDDDALLALCKLSGAHYEWAGTESRWRFKDGSGLVVEEHGWHYLAAGSKCWCRAEAPDQECAESHGR